MARTSKLHQRERRCDVGLLRDEQEERQTVLLRPSADHGRLSRTGACPLVCVCIVEQIRDNKEFEHEAEAAQQDRDDQKIGFWQCFTFKQTWAFIVGKFMTDGVWWFFLFWTPSYLNTQFGIKTTDSLGMALIFTLYAITMLSIYGGKLPTVFINHSGMNPYAARMYYWGRKYGITYAGYALWIFLEIFFMALFYTIYTIYLNPEREYMAAFKESAINTSLVLLLPYSALHLYFSYKEKERQLSLLAEEKEEAASKQDVFSFYDEKKELRLSIKGTNLLYLESADNYVCIWYLNKGALTKFMLIINSNDNV